MNTIRLMLVDDHDIVRAGLRSFLESQGDLREPGCRNRRASIAGQEDRAADEGICTRLGDIERPEWLRHLRIPALEG